MGRVSAPAPRRGAPRRSVVTPSPRNILLAGIVTAVGLGYLGPVNGYLEQRAELQRQRDNLERIEARRDSLRAQLQSLDRPDVIERRARAAGMVRPGERAFIIRDRPGTGVDGVTPGEP